MCSSMLNVFLYTYKLLLFRIYNVQSCILCSSTQINYLPSKKQLKIEDQAQKVHARSLKNARRIYFFYILKKQKKSYILSRTRALYDKNSFRAPTWTGFLKLRRVWNIHALNVVFLLWLRLLIKIVFIGSKILS